MESVFKIINIVVIPAWILLAFFPKSKATSKLVYSYFWHICIAVFYTVFIVWGMVENTGGGMGSLEDLRISFENDRILLAAWAHYLVFDLFVGTWIVKDAQLRAINQWVLLPILLCTLMLGPVGLLIYLIIRKFSTSSLN